MYKLTLNALAIVLLATSFSFAQKFDFKVGKASKEEIELKECSFYPEANSMILNEYGDLKFRYNSEKGFYYAMEVAVRKKIFKITDADEGNIRLRLYQPVKGTAYEEITGLKAYTYNMVDGKVEKEKLNNSEVFEKRLSDYWVELSFAIPGIVDGTVIDYTYQKESNLLNNLSTWHFQSDIPTARSEFRTMIPEFYNYQVSQVGNVYKTEYEEGKRNETFTYMYKAEVEAGINRGRSRQETRTFNSNSTTRRFVMKEIPPIEDEPYMNNKPDIPTRVEFQLISRKFPNSPVDYIAGNYQKFNGELMERSSFGKRLENGNFIKDFLEANSFDNMNEKAQKIYAHIASEIAWDNVNSILSANAGKPVYKDKEGHVADINLTLIAALREAGITAYPILLSTRGNGTVHPIYPSFDNFNYVVAGVQLGERIYFCDAATKLPFGMLPIKCRNGKGWMVTEAGGQWVNMKAGSEYKQTTMLISKLEDDNMITEVAIKESGYAAYNTIQTIKNSSEEEYIKKIKNNYSEGTLSDFEFSDLKLSESVETNYQVVKEMDGANIIYVQPILEGTIMENPFTRENRLSPIDFAYQQSYRVISQITVPEGFTAELPEPTAVRLPDNKGSFTFNVVQNGNQINVVSQLQVSTTDFSVQEYPFLKQFFQMVADKNQEMIVLSQ